MPRPRYNPQRDGDSHSGGVAPMSGVAQQSTSAPPATSVFPDAPDDALAPVGAKAIFQGRLRRVYERNSGWIAVGAALCALAVLVERMMFPVASIFPIVATIGLFLIPVVIVVWVQHLRAGREFWRGYAQARGLTVAPDSAVGYSSPLLRRGDEREWQHVLTGRIGTCADAQLAEYTYTDVSYDDDGHRQETDHDFTLVCLRLPQQVAGRFAGVYCRDRSLLSFGRIRDAIGSDRGVELESVDFHKRYELRVEDRQDDIALYELFNPTFIEQLTSDDAKPQFEQVATDLVVFWDGHVTDSARLDAACSSAIRIHQRYLEEYQ